MDTSSPETVNRNGNVFDPVTSDVRYVVQILNYIILCGVISLLGIGTNIVNIAVFVKQGFKDSINISLTGLSVSDLACSLTMLWSSMCHNPLIENADLSIDLMEVNYAIGGWPHECFNRITSLITAFITLERCLCIAMPLKVKTIITPLRTKIINISMFMSMFILFSPFYFVNGIGWRFSESRNMSIFGMVYSKDREMVESTTFIIHSVFLSTVLLITVAICTVILIVKLNQKTQWRKAAVLQILSNQETVCMKEKKVIKMVTLISTIYIICYVPPTVNFLVMVMYPEFSMSGKLFNSLYVAWSFAFVLEALNSSLSMFVYLKTSSKYQETLFSRRSSHK